MIHIDTLHENITEVILKPNGRQKFPTKQRIVL